MNKETKIPQAPTVYCPKDGEQVPIWYCLGSLTQGREVCPTWLKQRFTVQKMQRSNVNGEREMRPNPAWEKETQQMIQTINQEKAEVEQRIRELSKVVEGKRLEIKGLELVLKRRSV